MKNKIEDLRNHLFETIELLKDGDNNGMTLEKAKMICQVSDKIIDTAKVEVDYLKTLSDMTPEVRDSVSGFLPPAKKNSLSDGKSN